MNKIAAICLVLITCSWSYMFSKDDFHFKECKDTQYAYCGITMVCNSRPTSRTGEGCESPALMNFYVKEDNSIEYTIRPMIITGSSPDSIRFQGMFMGYVGIRGGICLEAVNPRDVDFSGDAIVIPSDSVTTFAVPNSDYCMRERVDVRRKKVVKQKMSNYLKGVDFSQVLPK